MPASSDFSENAGTSGGGVLLDAPKVQGVDPADPQGTLPDDAKQNGIVVVIDRWPAFPTDARVDRVEIYVVGVTTPIVQRFYGAADAAPEFFIPVAAGGLPDLPTFEIFYRVYSINPTTSPTRRLSFAPAQVLQSPVFPDASVFGNINCNKKNPPEPGALFVWEGIRLSFAFDARFRELDIIELSWQGWNSLNGSGAPLTPVYIFNRQLNFTDIGSGTPVIIVVQPFAAYIEPMKKNHSAVASYRLIRNGAAVFRSFKGLVKIDRAIPGKDGYCDSLESMLN